MKNLFKFILGKKLTFTRGKTEISNTREVLPSPIREVSSSTKPMTDSFACPYCASKDFFRRGFRQKKLEQVQLYQCKSCGKSFTPHSVKGKHYPLTTIFDAISLYNLGYSLEEVCRTSTAQPSTISNWLRETADLCRFSRMREFAVKKYSPKDMPAGRHGMVITTTLAHRQLYRYRFHQAKCELMIQEEFQHRKFRPLKEFLEMVPGECPHQYFQDGLRASETPLTFSKTAMIVRGKQNYATKTAAFVLQSVKERKDRHETLQKFMLYNDSVTVATEVPVYLTRDDMEHLKTQLGFEIYQNPSKTKTLALSRERAGIEFELPKLITGHIDILQIRNGQIHILDYKPNAEKERPIEQLTLYAMVLSRLTGLRLFEFKCAWFDEKDYFEFYPLHVLHKPKKAIRRRQVSTQEGTYLVNKEVNKIKNIRPTLYV